jgi:hypothetical protein
MRTEPTRGHTSPVFVTLTMPDGTRRRYVDEAHVDWWGVDVVPRVTSNDTASNGGRSCPKMVLAEHECEGTEERPCRGEVAEWCWGMTLAHMGWLDSDGTRPFPKLTELAESKHAAQVRESLARSLAHECCEGGAKDAERLDALDTAFEGVLEGMYHFSIPSAGPDDNPFTASASRILADAIIAAKEEPDGHSTAD